MSGQTPRTHFPHADFELSAYDRTSSPPPEQTRDGAKKMAEQAAAKETLELMGEI